MEDLRQYMFSSLKNNKKCTPTGESIPFSPLMALCAHRHFLGNYLAAAAAGARTSWGEWSTWVLITHSQSWWRWFSRCSARKQVLLAFHTVCFYFPHPRNSWLDGCSPGVSRKLAPVEASICASASCAGFDVAGATVALFSISVLFVLPLKFMTVVQFLLWLVVNVW